MAWFLTEGGRNGLQPEVLSPRGALWLWAVVAIGGFLAALVFRRRAVDAAAAPRSPGQPPSDAVGSTAQVQALLVIAWALLEGPALLAGVLFMLLAFRPLLSAASVVYGIGLAMTFPRAEWFGEGGTPARAAVTRSSGHASWPSMKRGAYSVMRSR